MRIVSGSSDGTIRAWDLRQNVSHVSVIGSNNRFIKRFEQKSMQECFWFATHAWGLASWAGGFATAGTLLMEVEVCHVEQQQRRHCSSLGSAAKRESHCPMFIIGTSTVISLHGSSIRDKISCTSVCVHAAPGAYDSKQQSRLKACGGRSTMSHAICANRSSWISRRLICCVFSTLSGHSVARPISGVATA